MLDAPADPRIAAEPSSSNTFVDRRASGEPVAGCCVDSRPRQARSDLPVGSLGCCEGNRPRAGAGMARNIDQLAVARLIDCAARAIAGHNLYAPSC